MGERYRLLAPLGSGASGTLWRALDERAGTEVAVREPRLPGDPGGEVRRRAAHRLGHEARAAARVDHPAALAILDVVVEGAVPDGPPWIVTEYVPGESLRDVLARGPLAAPEAARVGLAVLGALTAAHAVGIVHRDVRAANVLLGPHGRIVLTDVGTARPPGAGDPGGIPGAGPAADLRSLGALLHTAVTAGPANGAGPAGGAGPADGAGPEGAGPEGAGPLAPLVRRLLAYGTGPEPYPGARETEAALRAVAEAPAPSVPSAPGPASAGGRAAAGFPVADPGLPARTTP
ncbi:serine/threonine-protein kinase [Streptomyces tagetis]|uniref:serine/threonine-protein kinase n=1 Tax=Streptomyces tagetis TaxID=2820809 RepID=UPI0027DB80A3|nr:serine/threonine-protein kinase [Streptomyces sp. RG38]